MICPKCGKDNTYVISHSRVRCGLDGEAIGRKRKCINCGEIFETVERWDGKGYIEPQKEKKKNWKDFVWR